MVPSWPDKPIQGNAKGWYWDQSGRPGPDWRRPDWTMQPGADTQGYFTGRADVPSSVLSHGQAIMDLRQSVR